MLAAFAYAVNITDSTVPATAPADFQAGAFSTFLNNGVDYKTQLDACFTPDQNLADHTDAFIQALKDKDWATVKSTVTELEPEAIQDANTCHTDPQYKQVDDAYSYQEKVVKDARADPDWQLKTIKNVRQHMAEIKANAADAETKWNAGDYYGAGQAIGKVDAILFAPWMGKGDDLFLQ